LNIVFQAKSTMFFINCFFLQIAQLIRNTILVVGIIILSFSDLYSQDKSMVVAFGKLKVEWGNLDNTQITLYQDGVKIDNFSPTDNGKFQFNLQLNHQYLFWFEKPGYVTKKVDFSTHIPSDVTSDPEFEPIPDFDFYVTLFKTYPEVDTMFFTNPVGKIKYDAKLIDFDYDKEYNLEIQRHIDEIEDKIKQKHDDEVRKIEEDTKQPVKEDKKPEAKQTAETDTIQEKTPVENIDKESVTQTVENEESIQAEAPNNAASKKSITDNVEAKKIDTKPESSLNETGLHDLVESPEIGGKRVTRTVITSNDITLVYIKVEYKWGGRFFFIEDEPNQYRNISEVYYKLMIAKKQ